MSSSANVPPRPYLFAAKLAQASFPIPNDFTWTLVSNQGTNVQQINPTTFQLSSGIYQLKAVLAHNDAGTTGAQWVDSTNTVIGPATGEYSPSSLSDNHHVVVYAVISGPVTVKVRATSGNPGTVALCSYVYIIKVG